MKVFAYNSSPRNKNASSFKVTENLLNKLTSIDAKIKFDNYTPEDLELNKCVGCTRCFHECECPLDSKDIMGEIKNKLEEADLIILSTPVYAHSVSSDMKNFIDRLSYWMHLLQLRGKPAVIITSSSSNGNDQTATYLNKIATYLGLHVIKNINFTVDMPKMLEDEKFTEEELSDIARKIYTYMNGEASLPITNAQRLLFKTLQKQFISMREVKGKEDYAEYLYWETSGMLECNKYEDMLKLAKRSILNV